MWQSISLRTDKAGNSACNSCSTVIRPCQPTLSLLFFLLIFKHPLLLLPLMESGSGAPLCDTPRALGGAPDGLLQNWHHWRFAMHPALAHLIYNQSTFQAHSESELLLIVLQKKAKRNHICWTVSGWKMGDMSNSSHGQAWETKKLVKIMGMWVWSVFELLTIYFGRHFGCYTLLLSCWLNLRIFFTLKC